MRFSLLNTYHRLPYFLKVVVASGRGSYLRWWRYDSKTEEKVRQALDRESWDDNKWESWQEERLAYILHRAANDVPYYNHYWNKRRQIGDRSSADLLCNWPILKKETLRRNPYAFIAEDCNPRTMFEEHTSGTTGKPLTLWWSKKTVRNWYALFEARIRKWNNVSRFNRWAIMGGQLITQISQEKPPFWVWNLGLNQLYLSSYHLKPDNAQYYINAMTNYNVEYLFGYSSAIETLARIVKDNKIEVPFQLKVSISNAEPLYQYQRNLIADVFNCDVRSTYGMSEIVATASECEYGNMHQWPEVGIIEVIEPEKKREFSTDGIGHLVCTGLFNPDMPLIRYDTGDLGALENNINCGCGRNLPLLKHIEGRHDDVIVTPDGRLVGRVDPVFKANFPIQEAQIIQDSLTQIRLLYIPSPEFTNQDKDAIIGSLRNRVGKDIQITMVAVDNIPRGPGGKFQAVISHVKLPQSRIKFENTAD